MPINPNSRDMMSGDGLPVGYDFDQEPETREIEVVNLGRIWDVIRRRKWLMLIVLISVVVPGVLYTKFWQKPVFEATAMMVVPTGRPMASTAEDLGLLTDLVSLAKSRSVIGISEVLGSFDLVYTASQTLSQKDMLTGFGKEAAQLGYVPAWALRFDMKKESDVITVTARAYDPRVAADLANNVIINYIDHEKGYTWKTAKQGREFVAQELESVRKKLSIAQGDLARYTSNTRLIAAEDQIKQLAANIVTLQNDRDKSAVDVATTKSRIATFAKHLAQEGVEIQDTRSIQLSTEYQQGLSDLARLSGERTKLIQEYQPDSVEVKKIDDEIEATKQRMKNVAETAVVTTSRTRNPALTYYLESVVNGAAAEAQYKALDEVIRERSIQVQRLPEEARKYADLNRSVRVLENTYESLSSKYYAMLINENSTLPNALFAATARPPIKYTTPNKKRNAIMFLFLGILLAAASAALAERLDDRVRYAETITGLMGEMPLGIIPAGDESDEASYLRLDNVDPGSPFAESFRLLHNTIRFSDHASQSKLIAVTSAGRQEGKSTVVVNLAAAMAMTGVKVIIVDCNLRSPSLREAAGVSHSLGFTDLVNKGLTLQEEAVASTRFENLFCLPSGNLPDNPSELLDSDESRKLFAELSKAYDVVILDCPAFIGLSDMQVISTLVDGVMLVVTADLTKMKGLRDTLDGLSRIKAPVIGSVMNRTRMVSTYLNIDSEESGRGIIGWLKRKRAS